MKKRVLLCILLALALCLCGCRKELPADQTDALYGEWVIDGEPIDGLPRIFTLSADGQIAFDGLDAAAWAAYTPKEDTDYARIEILSNEKKVYSLTVSSIWNNDYENLSARVEDKSGNFCGYYYRTVNLAETPFAEQVFSEWIPTGNNGNEMSLQFNEDGSCLIDDVSYRWYVNPLCYYETEIGFVIHDNSNDVYTGSIFFNQNGIPQLDLRTPGNIQNHIDTYYNNPLVAITAKDCSWQAFHRENSVTDYLCWNFDYLSFDNDEKRCEIASVTDDAITAFVPNADTPEYKLTAFWNGAYPEVKLETVATGETVHYYNYSAAYDPSNPEALYYTALYMIDCYLEGSTYYEEDQSYSDSALIQLAHSRLTQIPDYRDAQVHLDRISIAEHKLTSITKNCTDTLDNVRTDELFNHTYNESGLLSIFRDDATAAVYGLSADGFPVHCYSAHITYNEQGAISDITVISHDNVYAKCTPEYNDAGQMTALHIKKTDAAFASLFSYDEKGNLVKIEMDNGSYEWTYDEAGLMVQSILSQKNYSVTTDYTYENGILTQKVETHANRRASWEVSYVFTTDTQGQPLTAAVTSTSPDYNYVSEEHVYNYQDLYFYNAE